MEKKKINFYKLFSNISIFLTIGLVALLICMFTGYIKPTGALIKLVLVLLVLSISCSVSLTWIQKIIQKRFKILSWVMIGILAVFAILWIVTIFVATNFIEKINTMSEEKAISFFNYIQFVLIASLQFIFASFVANKVANFGKSNITLQVFNYLSVVMVDVWFCKLFTLITFPNGNFKLSDPSFLVSRGWWTLLLIAAAILGITQASITRIYKRRKKDIAEQAIGEQVEGIFNVEEPKKEKTPQEKLKDLKKMLDDELITQEEYEEKRKAILKDM